MNIVRIIRYLKKNIEWTSRQFLILDQTNQIEENFKSNRSSAVLVNIKQVSKILKTPRRYTRRYITAEVFRYLLFNSGLPS